MDYFKQNLIALQQRYPQSNWLTFFKDIQCLEISISKNNELTILYADNYLHSTYNPSDEAKKNILTLIDNEKNLDGIVFFGLGLLYSVKEAKLNFHNTYLYLIESNKNLLKTLFSYIDCTSLILDKKIIWIYEDITSENLIELLHNQKQYYIKTSVLRGLYQSNKSKYDQFINAIDSYVNRCLANEITLKSHSKIWQRNLDKNLDLQNILPYIDNISGAFKDIPALLIAAGSSLNYYLESIHLLQQKMLLICVDTALPTLHAIGINPDFVVAIDSQFWNFRHLDNLCTLDSIYITDLCFNHSFFKKRTGKQVFLIENLYAKKYDDRYISHSSSHLDSGGSVATVAFSLANFLGCSSIYAIGLDLAYHKGLNHVKGSRFEEWAINNCYRLNPLSTNLFTYLNLGKRKPAININGEPIASDSRLLFYKNWFESHSNLIPCYNLSLGLKIEGFINIKLEETYYLSSCRNKINNTIKTIAKY